MAAKLLLVIAAINPRPHTLLVLLLLLRLLSLLLYNLGDVAIVTTTMVIAALATELVSLLGLCLHFHDSFLNQLELVPEG